MVNIPIVTLDRIYIEPDEENIYYLNCTRVNKSNEIVTRNNERIDKQLKELSIKLSNKEIILADDVVFTGSVLKKIIKEFNKLNIKVVGIVSAICSNEAYTYFNNNLKYGIRTNYLMKEDVIDQICERDFYFGIAGSGILINTPNGTYKAPYFKPFGNPNERASIPKEYEQYFSRGCLERSIYIWEEIDKMKKNKTKIYELPEKIINTKADEEVVKTLKKEMKKI